DADEAVAEEVAPLLDGEGLADEGIGVGLGVLGGGLRPAPVVGLVGGGEGVEAQFGLRDARGADGEGDDAVVGPAAAALAAVGAEAVGGDAQGLAGGAGGAGGPEQHGAEAAPAFEHALLVFGRRQGGDVLVFEAPVAVRQVAAAARGGDVAE